MNKRKFLAGVLALLLGVLPLAACGGGASAASMRLRKTEGTVAVQDDGGADVTPKENMSLHSGYAVATQTASYAWIDLDEVKLTKLDENSEAAVMKEGKALTLDVRAGSLYFDITEPLTEDETLDIRTSTIVTAIRGTRGWVTQESVCLLDGTVTVTAGEQSVTVSAGQMARLTPEGTLETAALSFGDIPTFAALELAADDSTDGSAGLEDLPQAYQDLMQKYDRVAAGLYDMDGDGRQELLFCYCNFSGTDTGAYIYRTDGETPELLYHTTAYINKKANLSLMERGGKLYLRFNYVQHNADDSEDYVYNRADYSGPAPDAGADAGTWGEVDQNDVLYEEGTFFSGTVWGHDENGFIDALGEGELDTRDQAEYEAAVAELESKYTLVRVLMVVEDGQLVTGTL